MTSIIIDIFHNNKFVSTEIIDDNDIEKIKNDIEEVWGYDKQNLTFYEYNIEEVNHHLYKLEEGYVEYVLEGMRELQDINGRIHSTLRAKKRH